MDATVFKIDGVTVNVRSYRHAIETIRDRIGSRVSYCFFTINLDHCVKINKNLDFRKAYDSASLVSMDGWPIVWLSRFFTSGFSRVTGSDLIYPLCRMAEEKEARVFLFGTDDASIETARKQLETKFPRLQIVGMVSPPLGFDPQSAEADRYIAQISESRADVCLVALGAPKQEVFASRALEATKGCAFVCIGAGLDFIAGKQTRAPLFLRKIGMEWAWRLFSDPRRMFSRYFSCAAILMTYLTNVVAKNRSGRIGLGYGETV